MKTKIGNVLNMTHPEECYIREIQIAITSLIAGMQEASKSYTDGVAVVAMARILREYSTLYPDVGGQIKAQIFATFNISDPSENDTLGEDQ